MLFVLASRLLLRPVRSVVSLSMGRMGTARRSYSASAADYKLLEEVGYGASATVYRAIYLPTNEIIAVKCLDLDRCSSNLVRLLLLLLFFLPSSAFQFHHSQLIFFLFFLAEFSILLFDF